MTLLLLGIALFMAPHLLSLAKPARAAVAGAIGALPLKGAHALISILGVVLIVHGYQAAEIIPLYDPLPNRAVPHALMPFAFIMLAGAHMKSNLKRYVRHPMAIGVMLWAISHLAVRGDLASVLLFGAFGLYALADFIISRPAAPPVLQPRAKDAILVIAGLIAYAAVMWAHGAVFGVYVVG
ncbi:MAG: NnrU family protein [Pseudomonadota bacterium]